MPPVGGQGIRPLCLLFLLGGCAVSPLNAGTSDDREQAVCNRLLEPLAFWIWQRAAGTAYARPDSLPPRVEPIYFLTNDARRLSGYRIRAHRSGDSSARGFVLVAQGNATLAERLLPHLGTLAEAGYDLYLYDYRGYAASEGKRRLKAIVEDYREIYARLRRDHPGERLLYGMSFGGIVLLNVIGTGVAFDRAVIDSTPATISGYGCPAPYDPVANLPDDSSGLLLIAGDRDLVVPIEDSLPLLEAGAVRGAQVWHAPDLAHPFMDRDPAVSRQRLQRIQSFLAGPR